MHSQMIEVDHSMAQKLDFSRKNSADYNPDLSPIAKIQTDKSKFLHSPILMISQGSSPTAFPLIPRKVDIKA